MRAEGPYFDELSVGQEFAGAPAYTLTSGRAAAHQAILGDRLRLPLDSGLADAVAGRGALAHPAFVWDVAIGQSTVVTHHVRANLFYRNLALHRLPALGDTLHTVTTVAGLRQNTRREGRPPTGLAALRIVTVDQEGRSVLDFYRCAMLLLRSDADTGHRDDLDALEVAPAADAGRGGVAGWDLDAWRERVPAGPDREVGSRIEVIGGDVVTSAPELARLTLNVARVHHDADAGGGRRLVYGGHTIGLALSQVGRALPELVTVVGWDSCDHVGPVHEGDTLHSVVTVEGIVPAWAGGSLVTLRSEVADSTGRPVLDWRFRALFA
ncbi:acyl dehydratase [Cryptosporangium arvum]|uniref:Acyl dehydratase n=1 Tax=Cryptosporangium arvum DSM 44712 TaxID=927661 RepID=A0A010Z6E8_9ACTN|nr:acyl dehydratase [Cryptosporangium arvum]EXG82873.1 acyl dehydratase [Cryptosporangium arvum DSM 44712]